MQSIHGLGELRKRGANGRVFNGIWRFAVHGTGVLSWTLSLGLWLGVAPSAQARVVRMVSSARKSGVLAGLVAPAAEDLAIEKRQCESHP
jgi:hypothetical protein